MTTSRRNEGGAQKEFWIIDGRLQPKEHNVGSNTSDVSREMRDVRARLDHMDALKIDVQVLYPTVFLRAWTQDPTVEVVLCRSYNRWLADIWKDAKGRLRWAVMPPLRNMDETRKELKFGKENGACGIFVRGLEAEMRLVNPYFFRLYEMAQEFDLPVCFHSGNNSFQVRDIYAAEGGFGRSKLPVISAFHNLIMDEIPKKFPKVRWGFIEVSAQWIPFVYNDMELRFKRKDRAFPADPLKANNMYVACQCTDDLPYILKHGGARQSRHRHGLRTRRYVVADRGAEADPGERQHRQPRRRPHPRRQCARTLRTGLRRSCGSSASSLRRAC